MLTTLLVAAHLAAAPVAPVAPATVPPEQPVARVTTTQRAPAMRLEPVSAPERASRATGSAQAAAESNRSLLVIIVLAVAIGALLVVAF